MSGMQTFAAVGGACNRQASTVGCQRVVDLQFGLVPSATFPTAVSGVALDGQACTESSPCTAQVIYDNGSPTWWFLGGVPHLTMLIALSGEPALSCDLDLSYCTSSKSVVVTSGEYIETSCQCGGPESDSDDYEYSGNRFRRVGEVTAQVLGSVYWYPTYPPGRCPWASCWQLGSQK